MLCDKCGTDIPNDAKFCPLCGALVNKANAESEDNTANTTNNEHVIPNESKRTYPYQNPYNSTTNGSNANQEQDLAAQQREFEQQSQQLYSQYSYGQQNSFYADSMKKTPFFDGTHTGLKITLSFGSALAVVLAAVLMIQSVANSNNAVSTTTSGNSNAYSSAATYDYYNNKSATSSQGTAIGGNSTNSVISINKVAYDKGGVKVICKTYQNNTRSMSGYIDVGFFVENSSKTDISISDAAITADGYSLHTYVNKKIPAGEKSNFKISINATSLENVSLTSFSKMNISLIVDNSTTFNELFQTTPITISTGEKAAAKFDASKYKKIYSKSGVTVYYGGKIDDNDDNNVSYKYRFFVVNHSGEAISLSAFDASANDYSMSAFLNDTTSCPDNTISGGRLKFYSSDIEDNDITDIKKISLKLKCYSRTSDYKEIWTSEKITISV